MSVDGRGQGSSHDTNVLGQVIRETDAAARTTTHTRDAAGNLTKTTRPNGSVVTRTFDAKGNVLTETKAFNGARPPTPTMH